MQPITGNLQEFKNENRPMNKSDVKTLGLSSFGGTLEFYDFIIYVFFASVLGKLFFPSDSQFWTDMSTYGAFAAGYLARPLGGIVMSHFGDILGRKKMFTLSIFLMAFPTLLMGLLPTYQTVGILAPILLLLLRVLQGMAIGGELPGAWVFIAEHAPAKRIGLFDGILTMGVVGGILAGALVALLMGKIFTEQEIFQWAWRLPFLLGGIFGLITMYLRRWLHETPIFQEMQRRKALSSVMPMKLIISSHKGSSLASAVLTWVLTGCVVVVILLTPGLLSGHNFNIARNITFMMQCWVIVACCLGCITSGWLCDKIGAGLTYIIFGVALGISTFGFYTVLNTSGGTDINSIFTWYVLAGFSTGLIGATPFALVKLYPPSIAFTGVSFSYNITYAIAGGFTPPAIVWLNSVHPVGSSYYMLFIAVLAVSIGIYLKNKKI